MPDNRQRSFPILFGDFKSGYRIYDRVSLALLRDPFTQATNSLVAFIARRRVGGDVIRPAALMKPQRWPRKERTTHMRDNLHNPGPPRC